METALAFPEPLPEDPEVVATALETAGIFGVQGDVREALRWVRRAAELAGDAGIDDRAFALARAAADLTTNLSERAESAPPAASAAPPPTANAAATQASAPPPPPPPPPVAAANRTSSPPREVRPSQPHQAVSVSPIVSLNQSSPQAAAEAASNDEEAEITSQHPPHRARQSDSPPRAASAQTPAAPAKNDSLAALFDGPPPKAAAAGPANGLGQTLALRSSDPKAETPTPEPAATLQAPKAPTEANGRARSREGTRGAGPQALIPTQVYEPVHAEAAFVDAVLESEEERPSAPPRDSVRQAARASIEQSQEAGVYILRLLKNGETAPFGTFEAMVVLTDPNAELFNDA